MNTVTIAYGKMLSEQGIWADGCSVLTCGGTTGHFVGAIAFCDKPETAAVLADAMKQSSHVPALLEALEGIVAYELPFAEDPEVRLQTLIGFMDFARSSARAAIALARGAK